MGVSSIEMKPDYHYPSMYRSQLVLAISSLCSITVMVLMAMSLFSSYWITTEHFRQGLLYLCIEERDSGVALPFLLDEGLSPGCYPNRDVGYLRVSTFLCLLVILSSLAAALLTSFTIKAHGLKKLNILKLAICTSLVTIICDIGLIIIYPIQFAKEIDPHSRIWYLNVAYGAACGCAILAIGQLMILIAVLRRITNTYQAVRI